MQYQTRRKKQTVHKSILIHKAQGILDLPQTSRANPVQCCSTRQEELATQYTISNSIWCIRYSHSCAITAVQSQLYSNSCTVTALQSHDMVHWVQSHDVVNWDGFSVLLQPHDMYGKLSSELTYSIHNIKQGALATSNKNAVIPQWVVGCRNRRVPVIPQIRSESPSTESARI